MGRGVKTKGPEATFWQPCMRFQGTGKAAGESGSCCGRRRRDWIATFQVVAKTTGFWKALRKCVGVTMPFAAQTWMDGDNLPGACDELELVSSGKGRSATRCAFEQ